MTSSLNETCEPLVADRVAERPSANLSRHLLVDRVESSSAFDAQVRHITHVGLADEGFQDPRPPVAKGASSDLAASAPSSSRRRSCRPVRDPRLTSVPSPLAGPDNLYHRRAWGWSTLSSGLVTSRISGGGGRRCRSRRGRLRSVVARRTDADRRCVGCGRRRKRLVRVRSLGGWPRRSRHRRSQRVGAR